MGALRGIAAALVLVAALSMQTVQARSVAEAETLHVNDTCACDSSASGSKLIRGPNQIADCDAGFYCNCGTKNVKQCRNDGFGQWKWNEDADMCDLTFECAAFFGKSSTETTPTTEPVPDKDEPCTCSSPSPAKQLIRGEGQVQSCKEGRFCDCALRVVQFCTPGLEFSEDQQDCTFDVVDCGAFFGSSTAEPTTLQPVTTIPDPSKQCTCDAKPGRAFQLIRGADQLADCDAGFYCNCATKNVKQCRNDGFGQWKWNEDADMCDLTFECAAFFADESKPSTETTPTTEPVPDKDEPCTCSSPSPAKQLIRGEDQVQSCKDGRFCDCALKVMQFCTPGLEFSEEQQECTFGVVDCDAFFGSTPDRINPSATTPDRVSPSTNAAWFNSSSLLQQFFAVAIVVVLVNFGAIYAIRYYPCRRRNSTQIPDGVQKVSFPWISKKEPVILSEKGTVSKGESVA